MRLRGLAVMLLVCPMMSGCFAFPRIIVFNNTDGTLVFHSARSAYEILSQRQRDIVDGTLTDRMSISTGETTWNYQFRYPPKSKRRGGLLRDTFLWQIEPDGRIYVVGPSDHAPTRSLSSQPEGFPLIPTHERTGS